MAWRTQPGQVLWQLALEVLGQVHRASPRSHLRPLLTCGLVLAPLGAVVSARLGKSRVAAMLGASAGVALAVAISLTLFRGDRQPASLAMLRTCAMTNPTLLTGDGLANVALFAPAAFLAALAIGRPCGVAACVATVSLTVEGLQGVWSVGVCDSSDALLNTSGALAAAALGALARSSFARRSPVGHAVVSGSGPCRRSC